MAATRWIARAIVILALAFPGVIALTGCENGGTTGPVPIGPNGLPQERIVLDGQAFMLDLAADIPTRVRGLGGRESIAPDGGMIFAFPDARVRNFVMRDCLVDIDIIYVNTQGRIVAMHQMVVEEPKREGESDRAYELRLERYTSNSAAQFVIELAGGRLDDLDLRVGQKLELDLERLKSLAN